MSVHWLLPINPAAHLEFQPADWLTRSDATAVWEAIGRSQRIDRWCLRSGYRSMRPGDLIWAYLSKRQEVCAVGVVRSVSEEADGWYVYVDWDIDRTARLSRDPIPREEFGQVPMSTCRANEATVAVLRHEYETGGHSSRSEPPRV